MGYLHGIYKIRIGRVIIYKLIGMAIYIIQINYLYLQVLIKLSLINDIIIINIMLN